MSKRQAKKILKMWALETWTPGWMRTDRRWLAASEAMETVGPPGSKWALSPALLATMTTPRTRTRRPGR